MESKTKLLLCGWLIALAGLALVIWQATTAGGGSDLLFNIGIVALIIGNVLRIYARYRPMKPKPDLKKRGSE